MRKISFALASAAFLACAATVVVAQTQTQPQQVQTDPNTKVYTYKKTAPKIGSISTPGTATAPPLEHLPGSVPFGSQKWWEVMGRTVGGDSQ